MHYGYQNQEDNGNGCEEFHVPASPLNIKREMRHSRMIFM